MKVKCDHRSKFSNLSNWKEEAWKKSGLQRDSNPWPPRYRCDEYLVYRRNPVVQCPRFGISKPAHYCRSNCDTICSCSLNFNIMRQGQDNKPLRWKIEWFRLACYMACLRVLSCRYSDISLEAFLLTEFRTSGYSSEWFVLVSSGMPAVFVTQTFIVSSRGVPTRTFPELVLQTTLARRPPA